MKSQPKRLQHTDQHHTAAPEKLTRLRRVASVNGTRIIRYQCSCCEPGSEKKLQNKKASKRNKASASL